MSIGGFRGGGAVHYLLSEIMGEGSGYLQRHYYERLLTKINNNSRKKNFPFIAIIRYDMYNVNV